MMISFFKNGISLYETFFDLKILLSDLSPSLFVGVFVFLLNTILKVPCIHSPFISWYMCLYV